MYPVSSTHNILASRCKYIREYFSVQTNVGAPGVCCGSVLGSVSFLVRHWPNFQRGFFFFINVQRTERRSADAKEAKVAARAIFQKC